MDPNASRGPKPWKNLRSVRAIILASGFLTAQEIFLKMCDLNLLQCKERRENKAFQFSAVKILSLLRGSFILLLRLLHFLM